MHDCSPIDEALSPGRGQQVCSCFCPSQRWDEWCAPWILSFLHLPSSLSHSVPLNCVVFLRHLLHFKRKHTEGLRLDCCIDQQWINRKFDLLLVGTSLTCNTSPATNRLLLQGCIFLFLLLCFCWSSLHLIGCCELVSGVCWATHKKYVQWHVLCES